MITSAAKVIIGLLSLSIVTQYLPPVDNMPMERLEAASECPYLCVAIPPRGVFDGHASPASSAAPPIMAKVYVPLIAATRIHANERRLFDNKPGAPSDSNASNRLLQAKDLSTDFILGTWINKDAPVDAPFFKRVFDSVQVAFFIDNRTIPNTRDFLRQHISELKAANVTDLAVDLPPDLEEAVVHFLKTHDREPFVATFGAEAFDEMQSLLQLFQAAHREGIQIRFFDVSLLYHPMSLEARTSEGLKQQMAANLYDRILAKNPRAKVAVLAGAGFATRSGVPAKLRDSFGIPSFVFDVPYIYNRFAARDANADAILTSDDDDVPQKAGRSGASQIVAPRVAPAPSRWSLSSDGRLHEAIREGRKIGRRVPIQDLEGLQKAYDKHFKLSLEDLARFVTLTDAETLESQSHIFMRQVIYVTTYAAAIVGMIEKYGHSKLGMSLDERRYWINLLGSETDPKDMALVRQGLAWLVDAFDLTRRPDIVERINAPIKFMGYAAYAEVAMDLAEMTLKLGWSANARGRGVLSIFSNIYSTFSNGGASHHTFRVGTGDVRRIFISNGNSEAETLGDIVHEMTHEILFQLHPSFKDDEPEEVTKMSDWFTSALEMISVYRAGGIAETLTESTDGLISSTFYHASAFERQIQKIHALSTAERVAQIDRSVQDSLDDMLNHPAWNDYMRGSGRRIHFYLRGAAFGAEALKRAREFAAAAGRPTDDHYIYALAGKYVAAGAMGGANQTFAEVVARSDAALEGYFKTSQNPAFNSSSAFGRNSISNESISSQWIQENRVVWHPAEARPTKRTDILGRRLFNTAA